MDDIKIGNMVRSFDFSMHRMLEGEMACYFEGFVKDIVPMDGCSRYEIEVTKHVFGGVDKINSDMIGEKVYPPVNGTPALFCESGVTDGVENVEI